MLRERTSYGPRIGLGTWQLTGPRCEAAVATAIAAGYRHLDTAQGYENEAEVGRALRASSIPRGDLFVTTKVWPDHLAERGSGVVEESLKRLGLGQLDLLLVHWPSPTLPLASYLPPLAAAREAGLTRAIGVSNFPPRLLERAAAMAPLACHQVEWHPYLDQRPLIALGRRLGLWTEAYSPLAHGRVATDPALQRIGARHGRSAAWASLSWLLREEDVVVLPKASSETHLRDNLEADPAALTAEEHREIAALACGHRVIDPDFAPDWENG